VAVPGSMDPARHVPAEIRSTEPYVPLRERLKKEAPDLATDLERQRKQAQSEWFAAISPHLGSTNSGPHVANIEGHLDRTLEALHEHKPTAGVLQMRPIEVYVLLAAVLFHDLGRTRDGDRKKDSERRKDKESGEASGHGAESRTMLDRDFASFGIHNRELARSLARICESHTATPEKRRDEEHRLRMGDVVIDPYGLVRERMIGALLTLGDHMDCAQTRVIPDYIAPSKEAVGAFRNIIRGVVADPVSHCVRTTLVADEDDLPARKAPVTAIPDKDRAERDGWIRKFATELGADSLTVSAHVKGMPGTSHGFRADCNQWLRRLGRPEDSLTGRLHDGPDFTFDEQLLTWNLVYGNRADESPWPRSTLVAMVLGDLRANRYALHSIRDHLAAVGLPLATWLLDSEERLYTPDCLETFEPVLHKSYLIEVARTMWDLSTRVFGVSEFTYRELASQLGDRDVARVKLAARRLAIVSADCGHDLGPGKEDDEEKVQPGPLWVGDETWRWRIRRDKGRTYVPLAMVQGMVEALAEADTSQLSGVS
jgi:hypothetical protein